MSNQPVKSEAPKSDKPSIEAMKAVAKLTSDILRMFQERTMHGVELGQLDQHAAQMLKEAGAESYNKGYQPEWAKIPYPAIACYSINEQVCHAPPGDRILKAGDIV